MSLYVDINFLISQINLFITFAFANLETASFEKLKFLMQNPPARPASIFLKVVKSANISSGEVLLSKQNFALQVCDIALRYPIL